MRCRPASHLWEEEGGHKQHGQSAAQTTKPAGSHHAGFNVFGVHNAYTLIGVLCYVLPEVP